MNDWIDYDGKGMPVADDVIVDIMTVRERDGYDEFTSEPARADHWDWSIERSTGDIVAYRIVESEDAQ